MLPTIDILEQMEFPEPSGEVDTSKIEYVIQYIGGRIDAWRDPFFLMKKKCPPTVPPYSIHTLETQKRYLAQPFPLSKIDSVSFERAQMNNLILSKEGTLLQLLFLTENTEERPGYQYVEVVEYHTPVGVFLARRTL